MNRKYSGFTLIEMLIVMGIIIILMAVGIAAGRFAIQRAADVAHQNAADQLFVAATSHLTDWREYPVLNVVNDFTTALQCTDTTTMHCLGDYMSIGEFRGGTDATYYYWTDDQRAAALVCVSLGGIVDEQGRGYYCTGTGFSHPDQAPGSLISEKDVQNPDALVTPAGSTGWNLIMDWNNEDSVFIARGGT